ncbi:MAG TPA: D-alanyl-D-alanine carboxypeptidase family protein [Stellaceae bacterium]|nr:D-alanyl-D-alanine carboxypeptidase family protein [Stellaceae bacterium]
MRARSAARLAAAGLCLCLACPAPADAAHARLPPAAAQSAAKGPAGEIETQARYAYITEVETGATLLAVNPDARFPPASMSKMMTAYVVFSMLKDGHAKLTDQLPVSEEAWRLGGSKMFVPLGGHIAIEDLLQGMIVDSGNDACLVLAEGLAGSEAAFVERMNRTAQKIGLKNSHFANVTGLPDPNEWVTARDLATLALRTIKDFPQYYHYYKQIDFTFNNIKQGNRNPLLYDNIGADGLKTGHTEESGYSLTGSVVQGRRHIILVLSGLPTMRARLQESRRLAEWALREFDDYALFKPGETVDEAPVWLGASPRVALTVSRDLVVTLRREARRNMKVAARYDSPIPAPVRQGEVVGKLAVSAPGADTREVPLVAEAAIARMGAFGRIGTLAGYLIWGRHEHDSAKLGNPVGSAHAAGPKRLSPQARPAGAGR